MALAGHGALTWSSNENKSGPDSQILSVAQDSLLCRPCALAGRARTAANLAPFVDFYPDAQDRRCTAMSCSQRQGDVQVAMPHARD